MKHDYFVVQKPSAPAKQLLLLFHGVGDNPVAMGEIGSWFAPLFPDALVVSIGGPMPSGPHHGREWFSVADVTEENRQDRIDTVMPTFIEAVRYWQKQSSVSANATALIGFSQGAMMALEGVKAEPDLASRVVAFSGRYAEFPKNISASTTIHLIHGDEDQMINVKHVFDASEALERIGGDFTLDIVDNLGHAIDERSIRIALDHLRYTVPKHYFDEALSGGAPKDDDIIELL